MWRAPDRATLALALSIALTACGSPPAPASAPSAPSPRAPFPDAGAPHESTASDGLPSLDVLAARGATDAPLMREALRAAALSPRSADIRAERDLCVRAVFAASAPVRASFADDTGGARGEPATGASGVVPPRGPVCVKKGEVVHLVVESANPSTPATARAVVFASP